VTVRDGTSTTTNRAHERPHLQQLPGVPQLRLPDPGQRGLLVPPPVRRVVVSDGQRRGPRVRHRRPVLLVRTPVHRAFGCGGHRDRAVPLPLLPDRYPGSGRD
jgi:hypothetical protein